MYQQGSVPRHGEETELYVHSWTRKGFFGSYATLYKTRNPGEPVRWDKGLGPCAIDLEQARPSDGERADGGPLPLLTNGDVTLSVSRRREAMPFCWRNADADELYFIHRGSYRFETEFGRLSAEPGDFVYFPRNVVYRAIPAGETLCVVLETQSLLELAERYHRDHGETGAGLDLTALVVPEPETARNGSRPEYEVRIKVRGEIYSSFFDYDPTGVTVGWAGDPIVYKLSAWDVPCARLPSTPPTASVFMTEEKECVVTVHTPMPMGGRRVGPPAHTNDYDETWFTHTPDAEGSGRALLRWDPQGVTQPGARRSTGEAPRRDTEGRRLNLNVDVLRRLHLTREAEAYVVESRPAATAAATR